ncbi:MAG: radical SAM protein [Planctomycetota bacterium]|nr:radical SAM protein [Planctomycetota bacterium]
MGILSRIRDRFFINRQDSMIFEVTQRCNHACLYCYNVWHIENVDYPRGELDTEGTKRLIREIVRQTKCRQLTFTGGEPFLRSDLLDLISFTRGLGVTPSLISNGSLVDDEAAKAAIARGVSLFEFPLLSSDRKVHDHLSQSDCYDRATEAIANVKFHGGMAVAVFVGTKLNIDGFKDVVELAIALGCDSVMFNRMNVGGRGCKHVAELLPSAEQVARALDTAEAMMEKYGIGISCSIPVQPCIVDITKYKKLHFGYCAAGTKRSYYTVDPIGNVRMCNHTPSILGNILTDDFSRLARGKTARDFVRARPASCTGCALEDTCLGGCKAAAEACYGSLTREEPFLGCNAPAGHRILSQVPAAPENREGESGAD